jgi:hypothetical protein
MFDGSPKIDAERIWQHGAGGELVGIKEKKK